MVQTGVLKSHFGPPMPSLSKSKLLAYRQCPKRVWLEVHRPKLREDSAQTQAAFAIGHGVGALARRLYDPEGAGSLIDVGREGFRVALARTQDLVASSSSPIFEAGFAAAGGLAFADILLPVMAPAARAWRMIEIKASGGLKLYHRDDAAIQHYVATQAGVPLAQIAVGHIDTSWVYPGDDRYEGIFVEKNLTAEASARHAEVAQWIADAQVLLASDTPPVRSTGPHCSEPYECGFLKSCRGDEPEVEHPVTWLPRLQNTPLREFVAQAGIRSLEQVPDELLNTLQRRVKEHTLAGTVYFDAPAAAAELARAPLPALFLDFETIAFAVPIWAGTRPYQQIPFQYSLHRLAADGKLGHHAFLDLSGEDPSRRIAEDLVRECAGEAPVFAYNKGFEGRCLSYLADRFEDLRPTLLDIADRLCDLLPIVRQTYYHPSQQGSWGLKSVLPALVPDLSYAALEGVRDGATAQDAYAKAVHPDATAEGRAEIERQLLAYCHLDTLAMVRLREVLLSTATQAAIPVPASTGLPAGQVTTGAFLLETSRGKPWGPGGCSTETSDKSAVCSDGT